MKYKAMLKNLRGEVEREQIFSSRKDAEEACQRWQLTHEYDFWETEIEEVDEL